jgi:hypothetical protein
LLDPSYRPLIMAFGMLLFGYGVIDEDVSLMSPPASSCERRHCRSPDHHANARPGGSRRWLRHRPDARWPPRARVRRVQKRAAGAAAVPVVGLLDFRLVRGVTLHGGHQPGDEVVPAGQFDVDVDPRLLDAGPARTSML